MRRMRPYEQQRPLMPCVLQVGITASMLRTALHAHAVLQTARKALMGISPQTAILQHPLSNP